MGLLNLDKKVKLTLEKDDYVPGDTIRGTVSFDFGLETTKLNNVKVTFRKIIDRKVKKNYNGNYSYSNETIKTTILSKKLLDKGEYRSQNLKFEFQIPNNILPKKLEFNKNLDNFLEKIKIKGAFKSFIKLVVSFFYSVSLEIPTFEIEARLDIPWGKDVITVKQIDIYENKEQIENEKEVLTQIAKEEGIYNLENKEKIDNM